MTPALPVIARSEAIELLVARMSEAISGAVSEWSPDVAALIRATAPAHAMTVDTVSPSRGALRPRFASSFGPLRNRGRREDRVLAAPAVSRAICANKRAHEHTGQREHSGLPCAMALRLTSCSPRRTALLPPSPPRNLLLGNLTPAPRRQDHTTSPYALCALRLSRIQRPPLPAPNVVTIAKRPSCGRGMGGIIAMICPTGRAVYFSTRHWTVQARSKWS